MDSKDKYWSEEKQATNNFQKYTILQFILDYTSKQFNKTLCQTLPLNIKGYIQELMQTRHSCQYLKVLNMLLDIF